MSRIWTEEGPYPGHPRIQGTMGNVVPAASPGSPFGGPAVSTVASGR